MSIKSFKDHHYNDDVEVKEEFSDNTIYECEELIDELIDELDNHQQNHKKSSRIISKHDLDIESLLNSDFSNFTVEEMTIMSEINKKTTETSNKETFIEAKTETKLFEMTMDKLVRRADIENNFDQTS